MCRSNVSGHVSCNLPAVISVLFILLSIHSVNAHPQCLDSRPPFQAGMKLPFCPDYYEFGCCTQTDDAKLSARYNRLGQMILAGQSELWTRCSSYAKTFLCQTCSPYAAHIFDSEISNYGDDIIPREFPGLCQRYCSDFFQNCSGLVKYFLDEAGASQQEVQTLNQAVISGRNSFCNKTSLSDVDYCFPELLSNDILNGNISISQVTKEGCVCVEPFIYQQLRNPIFLKHANDGSDRMFVGEQIGMVHIYYPNGTGLRTPFVDIRADIKTTSAKGDERGMLGMAFHPKYSENGKFYIYYSTRLAKHEQQMEEDRDHKIRIEEFMVNPSNPNEVDYNYSRIILEVYEPYWNHNGGEILFGDDNYLYLFIGDGGKAGDPKRSGQNMTSLLGKVLRINVDGIDHAAQTEYSIPPDNPFADGYFGRPEIYAFGVRNIWRCGKDRGDPITGYGKGRIVCGDVGQSAREELDLLQKGANYGWNIREGISPYCPNCTRALPHINLTEPIFDYPHSVGKSVTGGHFYRGCHSPNLNGFYIYGDFMLGKIFRLLEDKVTKKWNNKELTMCGSDRCTSPLYNDYSTSIISFGEDEDGEVYMLSTGYASTTQFKGSVYKIVDPSRRGNPASCRSARPDYHTPTPVSTTTSATVNRASSVSNGQEKTTERKPWQEVTTERRPQQTTQKYKGVNGAISSLSNDPVW